jgi:MFS transporter, OFA family, oxalate/formate antiporter
MTNSPLSREIQSNLSDPPKRWVVLAGGMILNMAVGTFYGISVFLLPLEKEFGWTRAQTSLVVTIANLTAPACFIFGGMLYDRKGPRIVAALGTAFFSLGFLLASRIHSLSGFYLTIGLLVGAGNASAYVVPTAVGSKWFPEKRGLIVGLMVGAYGAGSGIFGPLASTLVNKVGWRVMFQCLAVIFFVMMTVATLMLKNPPDGYRPEKWNPKLRGAAQSPVLDVPTSGMLHTRSFWILWFAFCLGATAGTMIISQLVPFARSAGHSAAFAAFAITVGAFGNASGRIFSGWLSDHAGRINTLRIMLAVSTIAMPVLFLCRRSVPLFYALLIVVYYCYGTQLSVYASTIADRYGTKFFGLNFGMMIIAWSVAGVLGPLIGGRVYVATGQYRWAFFAAALGSLAAIGILSFAQGAGKNASKRADPDMSRAGTITVSS